MFWTVSALRKSLYGLWLITGSQGIWLASAADVSCHLPPRDEMSANQHRIPTARMFSLLGQSEASSLLPLVEASFFEGSSDYIYSTLEYKEKSEGKVG